MCRLLILLSLSSIAVAQKAFFEKYAFTKSMAHCLGDEVYYGYLTEVAQAEKHCQQVPVAILHKPRIELPTFPQLGYPVDIGGQTIYVPVPQFAGYTIPVPHTHPELLPRQTRQAESEEPVTTEQPEEQPEPVFDKGYLEGAVDKIMAALSNYTCTLQQIDAIDEHLTIKVDKAISTYFELPIDEQLRQDLINGIYYCQDMVNCIPLERLKSPLPLSLQRLLLSMKCERKMRMNACFKHDLRQNLASFDLSIFSQDESEDSKVNKLATILIGEESVNELAIF